MVSASAQGPRPLSAGMQSHGESGLDPSARRVALGYTGQRPQRLLHVHAFSDNHLTVCYPVQTARRGSFPAFPACARGGLAGRTLVSTALGPARRGAPRGWSLSGGAQRSQPALLVGRRAGAELQDGRCPIRLGDADAAVCRAFLDHTAP